MQTSVRKLWSYFTCKVFFRPRSECAGVSVLFWPLVTLCIPTVSEELSREAPRLCDSAGGPTETRDWVILGGPGVGVLEWGVLDCGVRDILEWGALECGVQVWVILGDPEWSWSGRSWSGESWSGESLTL